MTTSQPQPSQAGLRPILDGASHWRVEQYAEATKRPFSSAVRAMILSAWDAYCERRYVEVNPGKNIPGEDFNTPRQAVAYYLSKDLIAEIRRIADAEHRTQSNVATMLLLDGLRARAAASARVSA
jgi:hypothetical protein